MSFTICLAPAQTIEYSQGGGAIRQLQREPDVLLGEQDREALTLEIAHQRAAKIRKLAVDVRLAVEATPSVVLAERPDAVVVATGSHPYIPPIPGSDGKHVGS